MGKRLLTLDFLDDLNLKCKDYDFIKRVINLHEIKDTEVLIEIIKAERDECSVLLGGYSGWFSFGIASIAVIVSFFVSTLENLSEFQQYFVPSLIIGVIIFSGVYLMYYRYKYQKLNRIYKHLLIIKMYE